MRIAVDIRCLTAGRRSGVEEYTMEILRHIFESDRTNEYILFLNSYAEPRCDLSWALRYPNVSLRRFRVPNKLLNASLWYLGFPKLDRLLGGVDVFFAPNINFLAVSKKTRLVLTMHDLSFEVFPETFSWKRRLWHIFVSPRRLARRADRIIAVSYSTRDDLMNIYGTPEKRITVVPSGISDAYTILPKNDAVLNRVREKYRLPHRFIFCLATLEPRKNIEGLVAAYEAFRFRGGEFAARFSLVIAGCGGWKSDGIIRAMRESSFAANILPIGEVSEEEKPPLYNLASLFVYPSLYEGFGFPVAEAIKCGTPVITSLSSSLSEVGGTDALYIDPTKPQEISDAMDALLRNDAFCEKKSREGSLRAAKFDWKSAAAKTHQVLTK